MYYRICLENWLFQKLFNMQDAIEQLALYFMIAYVKFRWFTKPTSIIKSWASETSQNLSETYHEVVLLRR